METDTATDTRKPSPGRSPRPAGRAGRGPDDPYDVAILGTGLAGSLLGTILAAGGARVLLLDKKEHPRFAIGESTVPHTSARLRLLAARYRVPELADLASFEGLKRRVGTSCGVKRHFGFVYHRPGEPQRPDEITQTLIPELVDGPESHYYRQDVDAQALTLALRRGAAVRQGVSVAEIELDGSGVTLADGAGRSWRARFLVDGSGHGSPVARQLGLRAEPNPLRTHSRTVFNHLLDVPAYDDLLGPEASPVPLPWHQGTLHHLFDGGWMWVIPFDNHPASTNPRCSVGLVLDSRRHPKTAIAPEAELAAFFDTYPSIAAQVAGAAPVREWVSTGRLQYTSTTTAGDRFCLLSHAAGFIDALFSRGLANTLDIVDALAWRLLEGLAEDDLSAERFAPVDRLQLGLIDHNDRLVHGSFGAFREFELWNAWVRIWTAGAFLDWFRLVRAQKRFEARGDDAVLRELEEEHPLGSLCPGVPAYAELFDRAYGAVEAVGAGATGTAEAAAEIFRALADSPVVPPVLELHRPERRHTPELTASLPLDLYRWIRGQAPEEMRRWYQAA